MSDSGALAAGAVLLLELLALPEAEGKLIGILFNKEDIATQSDFDSYYSIMDVDRLEDDLGGRLHFFCGTACSLFSPAAPEAHPLAASIVAWLQSVYLGAAS
jgi:hypothetical protein